MLFGTETKYAQIQGQRQVTEQAIAILVNTVPASFKIKPVDDLRVAKFTIPRSIPSTLLERRPDIAAHGAPDGARPTGRSASPARPFSPM